MSRTVYADTAYDGSYRFGTLHQHVDAEGRASTYAVDGSIAEPRPADGHTLTAAQGIDLSNVHVPGTVAIGGRCTVDPGGNRGSGRTLSMDDPSGHGAGTVVRNACDVRWEVAVYPGGGYILSEEGRDLVLAAPGPEPSEGGIPVIAVMAAGIGAMAAAGTAVLLIRRRRARRRRSTRPMDPGSVTLRVEGGSQARRRRMRDPLIAGPFTDRGGSPNAPVHVPPPVSERFRMLCPHIRGGPFSHRVGRGCVISEGRSAGN